MPRPTTSVRVSTMDTELEFNIQDKTTGRSLFDQVIQTTGIREVWYFGLQYTDIAGHQSWLRLDKKISKQDVKKESVMKLAFKFKYYPENIADEVIQDVTLKLLFLQVKQEVLTETIYCPAEKAVLLASYAIQVKHSDFDAGTHKTGYLANEKLLPQQVISQHKLTMEEWEEKVSQFHKQHRGMSKEDAMLEYLKIAQDLEMFGINYYMIYNQKGSEMLLGVDALGVNVYDKNDKFNPKVSFPWSEIKNISYKGEKFKIRLIEKSAGEFVGKGKEPKASKKIYDMCAGNHEMYMRRRRPDTLEVQQMKAQKEEEKRVREVEKKKLRKEIEIREKLEKQQRDMEKRLKEMENEMESRRKELTDAQDTIARLEKQLAETQAAREELERQQEELRDLMKQLEESRDMEHSEREKLEEEIAAKQAEIENVRSEIEEKEEESKRLQDEIESAKRMYEESTTAMQSSAADMRMDPTFMANGDDGSSSSDDDEAKSSVPTIVVDDADDEDREPDQKTEEILKDLRKDLESTRDPEMETIDDKIHRENLSKGRDKFKTLREVRKGNTKRRIDNFENM